MSSRHTCRTHVCAPLATPWAVFGRPAITRQPLRLALDREVPEQRRGEREHAAHVLPDRGRRHEFAPQRVGHVVVGELLDLLGELLAFNGVGLRRSEERRVGKECGARWWWVRWKNEE